MAAQPRLSFWQIWNMSFGFLGIQFGFALQGGFMSRIFQTLGADKDAQHRVASESAQDHVGAPAPGPPPCPARAFVRPAGRTA